ncbi:MAG: hypothetical protein WDO69_21480 [Pseudomonadota bacterium]
MIGSAERTNAIVCLESSMALAAASSDGQGSWKFIYFYAVFRA